MTWVMEDAPVKDATSLLILYALADRASDDGTAAWPSQEWIAERARCTPRTVRRKLSQLEEDGLIQKGNPKFVEHIRVDRRPTVWNLCMWVKDTGGQFDRADNLTGRTSGVERADTPGSAGGHTGSSGWTQLCPTNRPEPSMNHPEPPSATDVAPGRKVDPFDEFWTYYPKKVSKGKAKESWGTAITRGSAEKIIEAAKKFRDEKAGVERTYIPMPSTWLNQDRWLDYVEVSLVDQILEKRKSEEYRF